MQLHEVNTNESLDSLWGGGGVGTATNWLFRGHPVGCCVFIINCNVCKDRNEEKKRKREISMQFFGCATGSDTFLYGTEK